MLTPRRFLLFLLALGGFAVAYLAYSQALGSADGLPALPARFLTEASGQPVIINPAVPPTELWLRQAFGDDSPEVTETRQTYLTRFRRKDSGLVVACGAVNPTGTNKVPVTPISVALFGRPSTQPRPGDAQDISTFHADKAVLVFDREVSSIQDMNDKATLVGIELVADPDLPATEKDKRPGRIWITNNQKSADPADLLLIRTVGPLYYEVPPDNKPHDPDVAQVWTAAPVEVFDRKTLPRPLHAAAPLAITVPTAALPRPDDLRKQGAIADILHGVALPPPTVVADGLKLYLLPAKENRRGGVSYSGVRELRLCEKVQMNLWVEGGGFPGAAPPPADPKAAPKAPADPKADALLQDPPLALTAAFGGGVDGIAVAERVRRKSLLLVETPGSFRYDLENAVATFDIAPHHPDNVARNEVTVERMAATDAKDILTCTRLRLDLQRPEGKEKEPANPAAKPPAGKPASTPMTPALDSRDGGLSIRKITATGPRVYISVAAEQFTAQGTELVHDQDAATKVTTTVLVGAPVFADRDGSQLRAGTAAAPGRVEIVSRDAPPPPAGKKTKQAQPARLSTVTVHGPGRMEMFDRETNRSTGQASWGTRLVHEKVTLGDQPLDRLTFVGGGTFADTDGEFRLTSDKLRLWLSEKPPAEGAAEKRPDGSAQASLVPHSLVADGNVDAKSPEMLVKKTDQLTVWFRDIAPPKAEPDPAVAAAPKPAGSRPMVPPSGPRPASEVPLQPVPLKEPEPLKTDPNPIHLSARIVETWVTRYPVSRQVGPPPPRIAGQPGQPPGSGGLKYELERARCEDRVVVHQDPDPADPAKPSTGLDIVAAKLNLDHSPKGGLLTVTGGTGPEALPAEVTFEDTKLFGPVVVIDQPNNAVRVTGRGKLKMRGGSDLAGDPNRPSNLEVTWATEMRFQGAKSFAEFVGSVVASQLAMPDPPLPGRPAGRPPAGSTVPLEVLPDPKNLGEPSAFVTRNTLLGHRLDVTFDRPVYFNQARRADRARPPQDGKDGKDGRPTDRPKLQSAVVSTIPDDEIQQASTRVLKEVMFIEEVFDPARQNKYVRARVLRAGQIDFAVKGKDQEMLASGPGELRLLQPPDAAQGPGPAAAPARPGDPPPSSRLTVVSFNNRMTARDRGGVYREAKFDGQSRTAQIPTQGGGVASDLKMDVQWHALPKGSTRVECDDRLTVSQAQANPDAKMTQWMTAVGNAQFRNKDYEGFGGTITDDGEKVIFDGTPNRPARLFSTKVGVNDRPSHSAEQIQYHRDGGIKVSGAGSGTILNR